METLRELVKSGSNAELEALATNPYLDDEAIEHLLEKEEEFSELSEIRHLRMLVWLGKNPRMAQPLDDSILDGGADYSHHKVFSVAWELARTMEPNQTNASVLCELLQRAHHPVGYKNPEEVVARWRIEDPPKEDHHPLESSFFLRNELANLLKVSDVSAFGTN